MTRRRGESVRDEEKEGIVLEYDDRDDDDDDDDDANGDERNDGAHHHISWTIAHDAWEKDDRRLVVERGGKPVRDGSRAGE